MLNINVTGDVNNAMNAIENQKSNIVATLYEAQILASQLFTSAITDMIENADISPEDIQNLVDSGDLSALEALGVDMGEVQAQVNAGVEAYIVDRLGRHKDG